MIPDETAKTVRQLTLRVKELEAHSARTRAALICAFNQMLDLKDLNTGCHSTRLAEWGVRVARDLGADESCLHDIETAALLHDIGKVGIPDAILHKAEKLNEDEWMLMKKHPEYGWMALRNVEGFEQESLMVLHHHERLDGRGYPAGLRGSEIPLGSRIITVADSFDALTTDRPYRPGRGQLAALQEIMRCSGTQFDPAVVDAFIRSMPFP